jgi:hypothetical protein
MEGKGRRGKEKGAVAQHCRRMAFHAGIIGLSNSKLRYYADSCYGLDGVDIGWFACYHTVGLAR